MVTYYIVGQPGYYVIKSCGNNRIIVRDLPSIEDAKKWLTEYRPGSKLESY